jgi:hypothetical protein
MTAAERVQVDNLLSVPELDRLEVLEKIIRTGISTFASVGEALTEIRDSRLYRETDRTWGDYVERAWGFSRQHAGRLITAAEAVQVLEPIGLHLNSEREARELKGTVKIVEALSPESQQALSTFLKTSTGSDRPTTSQVKAVAEVVQKIDAHGTVQHPDNGEEVPFASLTGEQRVAVVRENVTNSSYERLKRQEGHIQEKVLEANQTGRGGWTDWMMTKGKELTEHQELQLIVRPDPSGNPVAFVRIVDTKTGHALACGETASYLKKAVLLFVEENGK